MQASGWTLLIVHFFVEEPIREQILAMESIVCSLCTELKPLHIVTFFVLAIYFIQTSYEWLLWSQLVHHIIVAACIIGRVLHRKMALLVMDIAMLVYEMAFFYINILSTSNTFGIAMYCVWFVAQKRFAKTFKDGFKWCWILLVHECALCALPLQMLYMRYILLNPERLNLLYKETVYVSKWKYISLFYRQ